ncbi:unnamed protein product [Plutella xylostella]|uniref:(diamondback moth) hypothetical protein n=1 Tax=Plutella xylostella TaxID=51655 RepID=A0A8S4EVR8_PLUXY|nr:unnamed protein product [Plutella xylostella]
MKKRKKRGVRSLKARRMRRDGILLRSSRSSAALTARSTPVAEPELHWSRNCVAAKICGFSIYRLVACEDETIGPIFIKEPPNRVDFSNTTGAVVECAARGSPTPDVIWVRADGSAVGDVPGLRQVLPNGNLVFPPFRAEDYRQEVHAQVYACLARNPTGSIHSRDVNVRAAFAERISNCRNKLVYTYE